MKVHPFIPKAPLEAEAELPHFAEVEVLEAGLTGESPGVEITQDGDAVVVDFEPQAQPVAPAQGGHYANLAETLSETKLAVIADEICEMVQEDLDDRKDWEEKLARGMELLGLKKMPDEERIFPQAAITTYPMLAEACIQFQARAVAELLPAGGPVKTMVLGKKTQELEERSERVEGHMNYQLMVEDEDYYPSTDRMLWELALEGSRFKKVLRDESLGINCSEPIPTADFIVPTNAHSLRKASRYTHRQRVSRAMFEERVATGLYRKVELSIPSGFDDAGPIDEAKREAIGVTLSQLEQDREHIIYETHIHYKLPDDTKHRHYVIHIDRDDRMVLGIYRNWEEGDALERKEVWFVHYPMVPAAGFYAFGYLHLIGDLAESATGGVRAILDASLLATIQGGFKSKDAKLPSNVTVEAGVYRDTECTAEELSKAFFTPNYKEPSPALARLVELLIQAGQRMTSTTESIVGDAPNTGPVGTTVALIEQANKPFSAIHKRLHYAQGQELRLLAKLNGRYIPAEGYPFRTAKGGAMIYAQDYGPEIDVIPVSDPNIFSSTQRIAIAQGVLQLADGSPDLYDKKKVHRRMLDAMRVPDPDDIMKKDEEVHSYDPVTENAMLMSGKPFKATPEQDHAAHIAVHNAFLLAIQQDPVAQQVGPIMIAHVAEHKGQLFMAQMSNAMGVPLMPLNQGEGPAAQKLPPEIENQIAARAAMVVNQVIPPPQDPAAMEAQQKMQEAQAAAQQSQQDAMVRVQEAQSSAAAEIQRSREEMAATLQREREAHQAAMAEAALNAKSKYDVEALKQAEENKRLAAKLDAETTLALAELERAKAEGIAKVLEMNRARDEELRSAITQAIASGNTEQAKQLATRHQAAGQQETKQVVESVTAAFQQVAQAIIDGNAKVVSALQAPRQLVRDAQGNAIGAKPVNKLN